MCRQNVYADILTVKEVKYVINSTQITRGIFNAYWCGVWYRKRLLQAYHRLPLAGNICSYIYVNVQW